MPSTDLARGRVLANLLRESWRPGVGASSVSSDDLDFVLPVVLRSGTAALAWRRIRGTGLAATEGGWKLRRAHLAMAAVAAIRQNQIERIPFLGDVADPILFKGWAHARLYLEPGLRPFGDIDLFVRPEFGTSRLSADAAIWPADSLVLAPVDLHHVLVDLPDRTWRQIFARSRLVSLQRSRIRVLGPEDDLRLSCFHLIRHATEMPPSGSILWLCDVSVMLDSLPSDFDWDYCLAGQRAHSQWILALIRLADQVLGAKVDRCPEGSLPDSVPSWMLNTFLRVWGYGQRAVYPRPFPLPFSRVARDIGDLPRALAERWPSPLQSVYRLLWPINRVSGRVAQVFDYTARALTWGHRQVGMRRGRQAVG